MPEAELKISERILVADIGGTHARLGIATFLPGTKKPTISQFHVFECADHHDMEELIRHYVDTISVQAPTTATLAVAGPLADNKGKMTNLGWDFDGKVMAQNLGFNKIYFMNDFGALAMATPSLDGEDLLTVKSVNTPAKSPISVIGPGTGFGVALMVPNKDKYIPISCEGGHMSFAPKGDLEFRIWQNLSKEMDRVAVETLLSGIGLMRLYRALCGIHGSHPRNYDPRTISQLGIENSDPICKEALTVFCSLLGSVAGDIALVHGAQGGIYLGGGILPKMSEFFLQSSFLERFLDKSPMEEYLSNIPIYLITSPDAALIGAAIYGKEMLEFEA